MKTRLLASFTIDVIIFLAAAGGTYLAQSLERPITAVLAFLTGVIMIAVRSGLYRALIAAIFASIVYNFLLNEPFYQFGLTTADQAVPLVAFNVSALVAGILVGRLKDSASKARLAQQETAFLLTVSDRLQSALRVEDIETAIRGILPTQGVESADIYLAKGNAYVRPATGEVEFDHLKPLVGDLNRSDPQERSFFLELEGARGTLGIVKFMIAGNESGRAILPNLQSIAALLALATERCLLLGELAEAQAMARSEALKDALLSSVSHDLRTPVTVIQAAAGALTSPRVTLAQDEQKSLLESIVNQCMRLDRYTSELLDVGRIQAGISRSEFESLDLAEIVQLAINQAKNSHPSVRIERDLGIRNVFVSANAAMLEQAVFNIIHNAQKFGGESGPIEVSVGIEGERAFVSVTDHGPGISERDKPRIFKRFFKGDRQGERGGIGLGLFIAKGFVEAFSGTIGVVSPTESGPGTRFKITLPLAPMAQVMEDAS